MFRTLFKKILSWCREIWSLFKVIDDAIPIHQYRQRTITSTTTPYKNIITRNRQPSPQRRNVLKTWGSEVDEPSIIRHRYIELDGYSESLRIDEQGRYDLNQLASFAENFVWISTNEVEDFVADNIDYSTEYINGKEVLWVNKSDCIEWAFLQYSAIADLL